MSEMEESTKGQNAQNTDDLVTNSDAEMIGDPPQPPTRLRDRVRQLLDGAQNAKRSTKQELAKDRTRSFALLIGGTVGAMLLFIGVFSTPTRTLMQQSTARATPNLGRASGPNQATAVPRTSVTPLLNADVQSNDGTSDQLSAVDIQSTSRQSSSEAEVEDLAIPRDIHIPRGPVPPARSYGQAVSPSATEYDPLAAYRLNTRTGTRTYSYGGPPPVPEVSSPTSAAHGDAASASMTVQNRYDPPASAKSSIVFIRSAESAGQINRFPTATTAASIEETLLSPGTRLLARLEAAATTAVKTPVVGSVEYNYERDGVIVIPAGAKVFGDVQQASPAGYLNVRFHTLQLPNGREEKIEAGSVGLDHRPLKGEVSGKNTGRKILSRTLSGIGTIAAYVVGAGGAGLGRTITGDTLLRDRLATNIALAGEQEFTNAAYSQNITVTVPANTRFYVVLQKPAVSEVPVPSSVSTSGTRSAEVPTVQELRELMDLKREINRMYQESNGTSPAIKQ